MHRDRYGACSDGPFPPVRFCSVVSSTAVNSPVMNNRRVWNGVRVRVGVGMWDGDEATPPLHEPPSDSSPYYSGLYTRATDNVYTVHSFTYSTQS